MSFYVTIVFFLSIKELVRRHNNNVQYFDYFIQFSQKNAFFDTGTQSLLLISDGFVHDVL